MLHRLTEETNFMYAQTNFHSVVNFCAGNKK